MENLAKTALHMHYLVEITLFFFNYCVLLLLVRPSTVAPWFCPNYMHSSVQLKNQYFHNYALYRWPHVKGDLQVHAE